MEGEGEDPMEEGEGENATSEGVNLIVNNGQEDGSPTEEHQEGEDEEGSPEFDGVDESAFGLTPDQVAYLQQLQAEQNLSPDQLLQV